MRGAVLGLLLACGDNSRAPVTARPESGARLALEVLVYEDGTRQLASTTTVFDTGRDEPCTIAQWSDGLRYCTPPAHRAVYIDDACTHEVGRLRASEAESPYALHEFFVAGELLPSRLYRLGEPLAVPVEATYQLRDGGCTTRTDFVDTDRYAELAGEIDRGELVHTVRVQLSSGDRLDALVDTSPDGLQLPAGFFDVEQVRPCALAPLDADRTECRPTGVPFSFAFADAACTEPAIVVPTTMQPPDLTQRENDGTCVAYHPVGALVATDTTYTRSGTVCTPRPLSVGERLFALGDALALPRVERHRVESPRRLQLIEDGETGFPDRFLFDSESGLECEPIGLPILADERCLPPIETGFVRYADPLCLDEVLVADVVPRCGPPHELVQRGSPGPIHPIGDPSPTVYEITTGDRCVEAIPRGRFHATGPEIPVTAFPRATREID
jgi:hypothetical protein